MMISVCVDMEIFIMILPYKKVAFI